MFNKKNLLAVLALFMFNLTGCNKNISLTIPDYLAYSPIESSFKFEYVINKEEIKENLDFITKLNFKIKEKEIDNDSYLINFIYKKGQNIMMFLEKETNLISYCDEKNNTYYESVILDFKVDEIINYLKLNGKKISLEEIYA